MTRTTSASSLVATGLRRQFGGRVVVSNLNITVSPGQIVGLLGPNGAGKTTTFRMLAGLLKPHAGRCEIGGVDVTRWPLWRRARAGLGYLPQRATIFPRLTVAQNVDVGLRPQGLRGPERRAARGALLERFGLSHLAEARGQRLSGGERRRVEIVRALAANPRVLLVDEPFAGLDPISAATVVEQLRQLADEGVGVLLTDHDVPQALEACDRIHILSDGETLVYGTPAEVVAHPQARARYLGRRFGPSASKGAQQDIHGT